MDHFDTPAGKGGVVSPVAATAAGSSASRPVPRLGEGRIGTGECKAGDGDVDDLVVKRDPVRDVGHAG